VTPSGGSRTTPADTLVTFTKAAKAKGKAHKPGTLDLTPDDSE
jgi:hypothetical protein